MHPSSFEDPSKAPLPTPSHICLEGCHGPDTSGRKAGKWWPVCPSEIGAVSREEGVDRVGSGKALPRCLSPGFLSGRVRGLQARSLD